MGALLVRLVSVGMKRLLALGLLSAVLITNAANVRTTLRVNQDGRYSTAFPCVLVDRSDCAPPTVETLSWLPVDDISVATGATGSVNLRALSLTGSAAGTATLDTTCAPTLAGGFTETANGLSWTTATAYSGVCTTTATASGNPAVSESYVIEAIAAPAADTTAPTVPTGLTATEVSGGVQLDWDPSSDPFAGGESGSGVDEYDVKLGSSVVHTVTGASASATPLLTPYTIGTTTNTSANQTGTNWSLATRGAGFTAAADNGYFLAAQFTGDVTVTAKIASFNTVLTGAQCGPMIRASTDADSSAAFILQSSDVTNVGIRTKNRTVTAGGFPNLSTAPTQGAPNWQQLARVGDTFTYRYSTDGNTWVTVASGSVPMAATVYAGIGVASGTTGTTATCEIEQLSITQVARLSYTHTTATGGNYSIRSRDSDNNNSAYNATVAGAPAAAAATQIKWNPGHYVRADLSLTGATIIAADLAAVNATVAVKGIEIAYKWSDLETTRGNYQAGFDRIDGHLTQIGSTKHLIIHLIDRSFGGTSATGLLPTYLATEAGGDGGSYVKPNNAGVMAKLWLPAIADRKIALSAALAARYDTNPQVEMAMVIDESAPGAVTGDPTYSQSSYATQLKRIATETVAQWPHTNVVFRTNFLSGQVSGLIAHYNAIHVGHGGPDVPPPPHVDTVGGRVWRGVETDPTGGTLVDYTDSVANCYVAASTPYATTNGKDTTNYGRGGVGYTAQEFYDFAHDELHVTHLSWVRRETGTAQWTAHILPLIAAHPATQTACPTLYGGACDTVLTQGASHTITGSGFGTKSASTPTLWDNGSHGQSISTRWAYLWHDGDPSDAYREEYWTVAQFGQSAPNDVQLPHSNVTKYLAGAQYSTPGHVGPPPDAFPSAVLVGNSYTRPAFPYYTSWSYYLHLSPNWQFPAGDHNHKWFAFANGGGPYPGSGQNWYLEKENSTFSSTSAEAKTHIVADDGSLPGSGQLGSLGEYNETQAWVKIEVLAKITDQSNGWIKVYSTKPGVGRRQTFNYAGKTDAWSGTTRFEGIGGYSRHYPYSQNRRYWVDIYNDRQTSGNARVVLTNNATFDSSTIVEWQPYTAWSNTSITFTVNKGVLPSGTVYLHLRDDVNGHQYLGPLVLNQLLPGLVLPFRRRKKVVPGATLLKRAA